MGFDVENFGLGVLAGWASAYGIYRARHRISAIVRAAQGRAASAQNYATQSADNRYVADLIAFAESRHLAGRLTSLSHLLVEPRFLPAPPLAAPPDDDLPPSTFRVVPVVHDHPFLHAPYNLETLTIDDLGKGERALALLGLPGSGRTTALMAIILRSLGHVRFEPPPDKVQQRIDTEEASLTDKQRAVRIKERLDIEHRAKERLAMERGLAFDAESDAETQAAVPLFNRLMPVYVHLADIQISAQEFGKEVDPAEPLVRAVQRQVGRITASTIPANVYARLKRGQVLLLVDGYDDLPEAERGRQLAWLNALRSQYSQNFIIVVGPLDGCGALLKLGLTPVYLRPWSDLDANNAAHRWGSAWRAASKSRTAEADDAALKRALTNNRALPVFDLTLKLWVNYADDAEAPGMEGWLRAWLTRHLPPDMSLGLLLPQLTQMAVLQIEEGYFTQARLQALAGSAAAGADAIEPPEPDLEPDTETEPRRGRGAKGQPPAEENTAQARLLNRLRRSGMIVRYTGGRHQFAHPLIAAYLASLSLKEAPEAVRAERALQPAWRWAIPFAALHTPLQDAVRARLAAPPDVLYNHFFELARWLAYASADVSWRGPLLKLLGNLLLNPSQYPLLRERAAAALITTRDRSVLYIFRQAARASSPDLRRIACLGMGAVGDPEAVTDLIPLLRDEHPDVQLAAGLALGAVNTESALEALVEALTEGSEPLRQAAAETFAAMPDEGYPILYDAIQDEDMMLRRAAVFGLRRVRTGWALSAIYRAFLEDSQWYVRSAAQIAFQELQYGHDRYVQSYPPADSLTWLVNWAAERGENMPTGEGAHQVLLRALQEGEPPIRPVAAAVIGQLGLVTVLKPLYGALRDRQAEVRDAAYRALADMQIRVGWPLPAPS